MGDDAAVLEDGLLLATDALVAGVHFSLTWSSAEDVGWKALAVNLSDIAAMAGTPVAAVAAVIVPPTPPGLADRVLAGLAQAADALACPLVGGDTTSGGELALSVAVLGRVAGSGPVLRSGAQAGDTVFVTGALGGAKRAFDQLAEGDEVTPGLLERLRRPIPRLAEGRAAASAGASAMIDVSDGLAADLGHLCDESGVGARIEASAIPAALSASLDDALTGGDDYELCLTAPDVATVSDAFTGAGLPTPTAIGRVTEAKGCVLVHADGREVALEPAGWEHEIP